MYKVVYVNICSHVKHIYSSLVVSFTEVSFNFFRSGIQQAGPEGPLIGRLPCGDSLKPWVPLSTQDLTLSVSEGFFW